MTQHEDEEPVAYLGGQAAPAAPADQPEEVEGYLGGNAAEEELPALPPAQQYGASDFIAAGGEPPPQEGADFGAPVEAPPEGDPAYDQYAAGTEPYDPNAEAPPEDGYTGEPPQDGYTGEEQPPQEGYSDQPTDTYDQGAQTIPEGEAPAMETSTEFSEPELPKTITQQDAENIIKRITTKKILPPEVADKEGPRVVPQQELTPRAQPGLKTFPIILVLIFALYGTALLFRDSIVQGLEDPLKSWVRAVLFMGPEEVAPPPPPKAPEKTEAQLRREEFEKMVKLSEKKAFAEEAPPATPGGGGTGTSGQDGKTPGSGG